MDTLRSSYALEVPLTCSVEVAIDRVIEALRAEGFGTLTRIDVAQMLAEKLGIGFHQYVILGACNPQLAHRALSHTLDVGLLLPCNVVVYESSQGTMVSLVEPLALLGVLADPGLEPVAREAAVRLGRVAEQLRIMDAAAVGQD